MTHHYSVPVSWAAMEELVVGVLKQDLDDLRAEWERVYQNKVGGVFYPDLREDLQEISDHIQAYKKIIRYYGGTP
jgi:hypothetical protein